jgi:hypothetical protein
MSNNEAEPQNFEVRYSAIYVMAERSDSSLRHSKFLVRYSAVFELLGRSRRSIRIVAGIEVPQSLGAEKSFQKFFIGFQ